MGDQRDTRAVNQSVEEHVRRLRERLEAGRSEIARQRKAVASNREHIDGVRRWIDESNNLRHGSR